MLKKKAILFDFDGVVVGSERARYSFFKEVFSYKGLVFSETEFTRMVGRTTTDILNNLQVKGLTQQLKEEIKEEYDKEYKGNFLTYIKPINVVVSFIKNYKGDLKFALASGSDLKILTERTRHLGIFDKLESIIGKDNVLHYKPHPESHLAAAKALGVQPNECIVIEDSVVGAQAAISAGIACYIFLNGVNKKEAFKGLRISGFLEAPSDFFTLVEN